MPDSSQDSHASKRQLSPMAQMSASASLRPNTNDRALIPDEYKWRLEDIYPSWEAWEADLAAVERFASEFGELKGTVGSGPDTVAKAFALYDQIGKTGSRVSAYAHLQFDLDQRNNEVNARQQRVQILNSKIGIALSWFYPELLCIPWTTMEKWIDQTESLHPHRFPISETYRMQAHVLDEKGEKLLSYSRRLSQAPATSYEMLSTADIKWPKITLSSGIEKTLTPASYSEILETERNQADRRAAFEAHLSTFKANENTYASIYDGVCQDDWFHAQARNYKDTLEVALEGDAIPTALFTNLIETTMRGVEPLRKVSRLRKKTLGLDRYDLYDGAIPLVNFEKRYPFSSVKKLIIESVAPLGSDYQERVEHAFASGWIDVYESDGKRSGAYSHGVYGVHPFILMNYNDTLDNMFTMAHEMGHSLHTLYSHEAQPFPIAHYTIFVAEVASTLNEALLLEHLLDLVDDPVERSVLLEHSIHTILGTFYSQVLFANYEREAHRLVEEGHPITSRVLSELYYKILKQVHGDSSELNELYKFTWARIPHFYRTPYYVYQYATSFAASSALVRDIIPPKVGSETAQHRKHREESVGRYLNMLKSGGSDHPISQLRAAGVDLLKPEPIQAVIDTLDHRVAQLEEALASLPS